MRDVSSNFIKRKKPIGFYGFSVVKADDSYDGGWIGEKNGNADSLQPSSIRLWDLSNRLEGQRPVDSPPWAWILGYSSQRIITKIAAEGRTIYGMNTGFGKLTAERIPSGSLSELQRPSLHGQGLSLLQESGLTEGRYQKS